VKPKPSLQALAGKPRKEAASLQLATGILAKAPRSQAFGGEMNLMNIETKSRLQAAARRASPLLSAWPSV
jgi:hypothetical protein